MKSTFSHDLEVILNLTDDEYSQYVRRLLARQNAAEAIDELDDSFLSVVRERHAEVARVCVLNRALFEKNAPKKLRAFLLAYNYNTLFIALTFGNEITQAKLTFEQGLALCETRKLYEPGKSLSQNVTLLIGPEKMTHDEVFPYFKRIVTFFNSLGKHEDVVEVLCAAALQFADFSAFQSAYRLLADAQEVSKAHKLLRGQIKILETQGMVALYEGDLNCAEAEFEKCSILLKTQGESLSPELLANMALVKLSTA